MAFTPLGKSIPRSTPKPLERGVRAALQLEAGRSFLERSVPALTGHTRLVSVKNGVVHAIADSAAAAHELAAYRQGLFEAMKTASDLAPADLRVEIRGSLESPERF
jgi:hypothetical protein